jgi:hypothetical protein
MKDEHKTIAAKCINSFGTHDHPYADKDGIEFFDKDYIIECLCNALAREKENRENFEKV